MFDAYFKYIRIHILSQNYKKIKITIINKNLKQNNFYLNINGSSVMTPSKPAFHNDLILDGSLHV